MLFSNETVLFGQETTWQAEKLINKKIDLSISDKTLVEVLYKLETEHKIHFMFNNKLVPYFKINKQFKQVPIYEIVETLCLGSAIKPVLYKDNTIVLVEFQNFNRESVIETSKKWESGEFSYPFNQEINSKRISSSIPSVRKSKASFKIKLIDEETNESIIGAIVFTKDLSLNYSSDFNGIIQTDLPTAAYIFKISYLGYAETELSVDLFDDLDEIVSLERLSFQLDEIEITAKNERTQLEQTKAGVTSLSTQKLESIPQATGEADLIKSLEVLPGVTTAGDLSSGFNVRGGRIDESLVLFNDAIIFNPTHVVGFISAFNSDIINNAELYKGYVDPEYGNRSSAVLDIEGKYGNDKKMRLRAGLGTSMVKATLDGPIGNKITYTISGRGSYSDYLLNQSGIPELKRSDASFYDFYTSLKWKISAKHTFKTSAYKSSDVFLYNESFGFNWSNGFVNATLTSQWTKNITSSVKLTSGNYKNTQYTLDNSSAFLFNNGINYNKLNISASNYFWNESYIKMGTEVIKYRPLTESLTSNIEGGTIIPSENQRNGSLSISPYITTQLNILKWFSVEGGLRMSNYSAIGQTQKYIYATDLPTSESITQIEEINPNAIYHTSSIWEPRTSFNFILFKNLSLKAGYGKIAQNAQIISLGNTSIPTDLWVFTNNYIKPRKVNQFTGEIYFVNEKSKMNASFGYFYKTTNDFFVLKDFPDVIGNRHIETELLFANQKSTGYEFQLEKKSNNWDLFLAYTYSKTLFKSSDQRGEVNRGNWYNGDIDIPHQLNLLASYSLNPALKINSSYTYKSGRPITVPAGVANIDNLNIPFYSDRNSGRIPGYSRLDLSLSIDLRKIKKDGLRNSFTFGLYNVLNNRNPFNVFYRTSEIGNLKAYKFSVIGTMVPSISWNCVLN